MFIQGGSVQKGFGGDIFKDGSNIISWYTGKIPESIRVYLPDNSFVTPLS